MKQDDVLERTDYYPNVPAACYNADFNQIVNTADSCRCYEDKPDLHLLSASCVAVLGSHQFLLCCCQLPFQTSHILLHAQQKKVELTPFSVMTGASRPGGSPNLHAQHMHFLKSCCHQCGSCLVLIDKNLTRCTLHCCNIALRSYARLTND